jgi:hypothetical protein
MREVDDGCENYMKGSKVLDEQVDDLEEIWNTKVGSCDKKGIR